MCIADDNRYFVIGIDFGTLCARLVLADVADGSVKYTAEYSYGDGVIEGRLPGSDVIIPDSYALQNPEDYEKALEYLLKSAVDESGVPADHIIGIGIDFTACTVVALDKDKQPLSKAPEYRNDPHSWAKLWKHHGPQEEMEMIDSTALKRGEAFIARSGNKTFDGWFFAKTLETYRKSPEVYHAAAYFMEAGDWMTYLLTGKMVRGCNFACCKACWNRKSGYPSKEYLDAVEPGFSSVLDKLYSERIANVAECVGTLTPEMAHKTGLSEKTVVATPMIDAHAPLLSFGVRSEGTMMMVLGTSICTILHSRQWSPSKGMLSGGEDIIIPGMCSYEASMTGGGDVYNWIVRLSGSDFKHMNEYLGKSIPGTSGLIALDWLNGNRCILKDPSLTGMMVGLNLKTTAEEMYRALVEATAFAVKVIVDDYMSSGLKVERLVASGGIATKSPEVMQVFADILEMDISAADNPNSVSLGAAMYAAVAASADKHGFDSIDDAIAAMSVKATVEYHPDEKYRKTYEAMYEVYKDLYDAFGRNRLDTMKELNRIKKNAKAAI